MKSKTNRLNQFQITKVIRITFLTIALMLTSCKENKISAQDNIKTKVETPKIDIHTAVITDNRKVVKQHIEAGTDINEKEKMGGSTPLISAALFGKTEIAEMLIDAGANLNIQNNDGSTALITAAFFCRPQIVKILLDKGVDKTIKNNYNQTAYDAVVGSFEAVKPSYEALGKMLQPMGLKLDFQYLEKTRPEIAAMLK
ncbi:MAG: ankyrin repeat domain-containing protein [Xanthomarina gelatinilytica]|uniref:ankyrin repeat domain-containing protein n=1 Tax=Xanthomarina gelatinilytica TaxID=1137281 RepID=UPI003A85E1AD